MTRIFLIRHGQTEWNRQEIFRGRADVPLSANGIRQAEALARRLVGEEPAAVYCSPLARAVVTAQYLCGDQTPRSVEGLIDISYGAWEGVPNSQIVTQYADLYRRWLSEPHLVRPPGGETLAEVRERAAGALRQIVAGHPGATVVVVSHRVVNKIVLCAALGVGDEGFWRIRQDTCCLNILEWDRERFAVTLVNDTCHLRGLDPDTADF
jgi:broad specificity phosphatase PhoE